MILRDLCKAFETLPFPGIHAQAHPDRYTVLYARSRVASAVTDREFLVDCISWELLRIEDGRIQGGLQPFFTIPTLGIRFAFGYWPPGGSPGPHEHTAWTITAVCQNELEVLTYDRAESYKRMALVPKNRFEAQAGGTGFIYEPCIHMPRNISSDWSLSLHITSPRDGDPVDYQKPLPGLSTIYKYSSSVMDHPYRRVMVERQRQRFVHQLARILVSTDVPEVPRLLKQCFGLASSGTRRLISQMAPGICQQDASQSEWFLERTHKDLLLSSRYEAGMVSLDVETTHGPRQEFVVNDIARETISFVARQPVFDVRSLPGRLSEEEREAIGEALEETGLFKRYRK